MKTNSQNTSSQNCKLIFLNLIILPKPKFPLIFMFLSLFILSGCKDEASSYLDISSKGLSAKLLSDPDFEVDCPSTVTVPSQCRPTNSSNCTRRDLDPCDYINIYSFVADLTCELNKFIHGCPYYEQQFSPPCSSLGVKCLKFGVPDILSDIIADFNPWLYCTYSDCSPFYCWGGFDQSRHLPISIAYQNAMLSYARTFAVANGYLYILLQEFQCENQELRIKEIRFYFGSDPNIDCSSSSPDPCHNTEIFMWVEYYCCPE